MSYKTHSKYIGTAGAHRTATSTVSAALRHTGIILETGQNLFFVVGHIVHAIVRIEDAGLCLEIVNGDKGVVRLKRNYRNDRTKR